MAIPVEVCSLGHQFIRESRIGVAGQHEAGKNADQVCPTCNGA